MDTKKYEAFEKTVELQSLTKAAQELGLTQSGVSHMLSAIEAEIQLPLLKRTRTGARLTPEGRADDALYSRGLCGRKGCCGRRRNACIRSLPARSASHVHQRRHALAAAMMMQFQKEHPQVDFQLFNGDYHDIDTWLGDGSVDLAFTTLPARPGCRCTPLYEDALAAVLPKGHPLGQSPVCRVEERQRSRLFRSWNPPIMTCAVRFMQSRPGQTSALRRRMIMPLSPWSGRDWA